MENIRHANGSVYFETVDGKTKSFKLDFNAIADLEGLLGKGIGAIMTDDNVGFNVIRAFYWAGLKHKDRGITVQRAGNFVQRELNGGRDMDELMEPVTEALIAAGYLDREDVEDAEDLDDLDDDEEEDEEVKN